MTALFGAFWITPDGVLEDTGGRTHSATTEADSSDAYDAIQRRLQLGWVRIRAALDVQGLRLYVQGYPEPIERSKMVISRKWGTVPHEVVVDIEDGARSRRRYLTAEEFYETEFVPPMIEDDVREGMRERLLLGRRPVKAHRRSR